MACSGVLVGYETVGQCDEVGQVRLAVSVPNDPDDEVEQPPAGLPSHIATRRRSDMKRGIGAMAMVVAFLWISVMPMQKVQERAVRGLVCLSLVVSAALLVGWAVKKTADDAREREEL
jgi:hypothetical protein